MGVEDDAEDMVIYVGEGINGVYNTPYFDATMKTNYSVQVLFYLDLKDFDLKPFYWENTLKKASKSSRECLTMSERFHFYRRVIIFRWIALSDRLAQKW